MIKKALALTLSMGCFGASAQVCNVASSAMAFGAFNPASSVNVNVSSQVNVSCILPTSVRFSASIGNGANAGYSAGRKMTRTPGGGTLTYNLYTSAARTTVFGDGTNGSQSVSGSGLRFLHTLNVYGRIAGPQPSVQAGSYADTVIVTVSY